MKTDPVNDSASATDSTRTNATDTSWQRVRLSVLGVPVDFRATDMKLLAAVSDWLSGSLDSRADSVLRPGPQSAPPPCIRLILEPALDHGAVLAFHAPTPHSLEIAGPGFRGLADARENTATVSLAPNVLANRERLEESVLATLTLFLLTRLDRQPFHAAAIWRNGLGLLLTGPSGSGKSTLAYAALRQGWTVLSDDAVYLQSHPRARIWARPGRLHLSPESAKWFEELANVAPVLRENGKWKIAIERPATEIVVMPVEQVTLCLLEPGPGPAGCRQIDAEDAIATLLSKLDPGFDVFRDTIAAPLRQLAQRGVYAVPAGSDPHITMGVLERITMR